MELVTEPGAEAAFNDSATNLLAGVIADAAGQRLDRLLVAEFFAPLGIADFYDDGRVVGGRADAYLGQCLVIYPEESLVGVRMIEGFPGYVTERDGFQNFQELLRELAPGG